MCMCVHLCVCCVRILCMGACVHACNVASWPCDLEDPVCLLLIRAAHGDVHFASFPLSKMVALSLKC